MIILKIDGKDYTPLKITKYDIETEILDGPGSGRMQSEGWPMFRQPQGTIKNISLEIGSNNSNNALYLEFIDLLDSFGENDFKTVYFKAPGREFTQKMYVGASFKQSMIRVDKSGVCHYAPLSFKLIAEKAIL